MMQGRYSGPDALARLASRFRGPLIAGLPRAIALSDPQRTPDVIAFAHGLPRGCALVYRHFGASDRLTAARRLSQIARRNDLVLLIAADPQLAKQVGAHGVHWPNKALSNMAVGKWKDCFALMTASAHSFTDVLRARRLGVEGVFLSPVFPTDSHKGATSLGTIRSRQIAKQASGAVYALGGIDMRTARRLDKSVFTGIAAIGGFKR